MYPFERFTERARKVLTLTQAEAEKTGGYIDTEHLLLALLEEGDGLAARALQALGVGVEGVRGRLEQVDRPATESRKEPGPVHPTPRTKRVIELAFQTADEMGHRYVGTEQLLLGLLKEGSGVAARVLGELGVTEATARAAVDRLLAEAGGEPPGAPAPRVHFDADVAGTLDTASDLAVLEGSAQVRADHLLLAMAGPDSGLADLIDGAAARAATVLLPGVKAYREVRRQRQEALERGDAEAATRHLAEETRLRKELRPVIKGWRERA
jgi:ATP-dependent Clp protease ATP-binding subunit ClpA